MRRSVGSSTAIRAGVFGISGTHTYEKAEFVWTVVTIRDDEPGTDAGTTRVPIDVMPG